LCQFAICFYQQHTSVYIILIELSNRKQGLPGHQRDLPLPFWVALAPNASSNAPAGHKKSGATYVAPLSLSIPAYPTWTWSACRRSAMDVYVLRTIRRS